MQTSTNGRALIEAFEGCEKATGDGQFTTYHDSVGVLTIGYGHTNLGNIPPHIQPGDKWSKDECDKALSEDLARFEAGVDRIMSGYTLNQNQFDALVSFDFNTGSLAKSSIPARIKAGNLNAAMATLLQYNHAGGRVLPGLTRRRQAERLLFLGEVNAALTLAGAHIETKQPMAKGAPPPEGEPEEAPEPESRTQEIIQQIKKVV
jgi:lysozyme